MQYLAKSLWLLFFGVVILCGIYPAILWVIGQTFFPFQANGSIVNGPDGKPVGSLLVAQPFTKDEYFWPRPSAASFNATASSSSALAVSNYALRNRVATMLGPIVKYAEGPKKGQLVAPDVEAWFQKDRFGDQRHIVAQWADAHNALAAAWVTSDPAHAAFVDGWAKEHRSLVSAWVKANPTTPQPKAADLAVMFFENLSVESPGQFPSSVSRQVAGKTVSTIELVRSGVDIQSIFFDMWRQDHPSAPLADVPGDMVTTSGSGLDPHITMENAKYQLDRVAAKWAEDTKRPVSQIRAEIMQILYANSHVPDLSVTSGKIAIKGVPREPITIGGPVGERIVNVLAVNLALRKRYGQPG